MNIERWVGSVVGLNLPSVPCFVVYVEIF